MSQGRLGLIALIAIAIWIFAALPLIYMPSDRVGELPSKAPILTSLAASCAALIALAALVIARRQLVLNRANQRETTAKATFREFLKLCVQYPDLAYGKPTSGKQQEYEWFVAYFLWAAEEILEYSDKDWETNLRLHMTYHKDFLKNDQRFRTEDFYAYSGAVQALIDDVVGPTTPSTK
jgi:hypothetical protein